MDEHLQRVSEWARERLASGMEPPTAYYRLMQLVEAADCLRAGGCVTPPTDDSPQSGQPAENDRPQAASVVQLDSVRPHRAGQPVLPPT